MLCIYGMLSVKKINWIFHSSKLSISKFALTSALISWTPSISVKSFNITWTTSSVGCRTGVQYLLFFCCYGSISALSAACASCGSWTSSFKSCLLGKCVSIQVHWKALFLEKMFLIKRQLPLISWSTLPSSGSFVLSTIKSPAALCNVFYPKAKL